VFNKFHRLKTWFGRVSDVLRVLEKDLEDEGEKGIKGRKRSLPSYQISPDSDFVRSQATTSPASYIRPLTQAPELEEVL
jgi:hypothetical protein